MALAKVFLLFSIYSEAIETQRMRHAKIDRFFWIALNIHRHFSGGTMMHQCSVTFI